MPIIYKHFSSTQYIAIYKVAEEEDGMRLDQFIQLYMESFSREMIKKKILNNDITIEGKKSPHRVSVKVHLNEKITLKTNKTAHEDEYWNGLKLNLNFSPTIIYQDDELSVLSKPPFMATHPTGKHLFNCATIFVQEKFGRKSHSIHRLDRETSGVLLIGTDSKIAMNLTEKFEQGLVQKCYFFIAKKKRDFAPKALEFTVEKRLGATGKGLKRVYIEHYPKDSLLGKHAKTQFRIIHIENDYVLGLAFPSTGRQHQIRVHAMVNGLPLLGDKLYLGSYKMFQRFKDNRPSEEDYKLMELPRHALHGIALKIMYKKEVKTFMAPIPNDLSEWIQKNLSLSFIQLQQTIEQKINDYFQKPCK